MSADSISVKLRKPVALKKGGELVSELTLKPEGRALRGLTLSMGFKGDASSGLENIKVFQRFSVAQLAGAALRMAGCAGDRVKPVFNELDARDVMTLYDRVQGLLMNSVSIGEESPPPSLDAVTVQLHRPVQFGKTLEPVEKLVLEPTGSALRELEFLISQEGDLALQHADIFELAKVGVRMAKAPGDAALVDLMHPSDVMEVASTVMGFIHDGSQGGSEASPSSPPASASRSTR